MFSSDFRQPVMIDEAPTGHGCEWCGKPARYQLTALGGMHHNEEGMFCQACAQEFARAVAESLSRVMTPDIPSALTVPA